MKFINFAPYLFDQEKPGVEHQVTTDDFLVLSVGRGTIVFTEVDSMNSLCGRLSLHREIVEVV